MLPSPAFKKPSLSVTEQVRAKLTVHAGSSCSVFYGLNSLFCILTFHTVGRAIQIQHWEGGGFLDYYFCSAFPACNPRVPSIKPWADSNLSEVPAWPSVNEGNGSAFLTVHQETQHRLAKHLDGLAHNTHQSFLVLNPYQCSHFSAEKVDLRKWKEFAWGSRTHMYGKRGKRF